MFRMRRLADDLRRCYTYGKSLLADNGTAQIPESPFRLGFTNGLMSESMIIWFVIVFIWEKDVLRKVNCCNLSHKI